MGQTRHGRTTRGRHLAEPQPASGGVSRRSLLRTAAAGSGAVALAGGWTPIGRLSAAEAVAPLPPDLPAESAPYQRVFQNWAGSVRTEPLWTVDARSEDHVVELANWAHQNGWKLRAKGFQHNWSPLTVADGAAEEPVLLVNTLPLSSVSLGRDGWSITAQAGASMDALLEFADRRCLGIAHVPAPGDITVGGALAVGGHGTAVPSQAEQRSYGMTFGSVSNQVTSLRAVVWDEWQGRYVARRFYRDDPTIGALLVHVGRAFVTEVTLRAGQRQTMRLRSYTDVPIAELLAPAGSGGRTASSYLDRSGRMEIIWFPFTDSPWLKVWTATSFRPRSSTMVYEPYPFPFADNPAGDPSQLEILYQQPGLTPQLSQAQMQAVVAGLEAGTADNVFGTGGNLLRYVKPTTTRMAANGYAILCRRSDVQWVLNSFYVGYKSLLDYYAAQGRFPVNGPAEIRVMGVDRPSDSGVSSAVDPLLSPTRRRPDRPEWDTVVYLDMLTLPRTPGYPEFYADVENRLWQSFDTSRTAIRVEWSKGWAFTAAGAYTDEQMVGSRIPDSLSKGQYRGTTFADAVAILNKLDPNRIYSSPLLDRVLPG